MGRAASGNLRPWVGSAIVHGLVVVALALAAIQWRTDPPPPQLAIEGNVVRYEDLPSSVKAGKAMREPAPVAPVKQAPPPAPEPEPEPKPEAKPDPAVLEQKAQEQAQARAEAEAQPSAAARNRRRLRQRRRRRRPRSPQGSGPRRTRNASRKRRASRRRRRRSSNRPSRKRLRAQQSCKAAQQAELRRALEDEEAGEALARSGVVDEYRTLLIQTIERNWNRPPSARAGLECTLYVTQATGGTVLDVKIGDCNGDQAVRESVANAVYRSSPLPAPRDARAFERRLVIVFKPTE